ncbi:hypothetical protein [Flagellimonas flava]|uniref:hypothetical protein n=1 Tax=Flagellimonas flava TaxID=570519 RepID=UPI003D662A59
MKTYHIHRDIRARALIFGLPVSFFAIQMLGVIASLLAIIFSFSFALIFGALMGNGLLYTVLLKLENRPDLLANSRVFPNAISNKKTNLLHYADES